MAGRFEPIEFNVSKDVYAMAFSADGKYLVSGNADGIQVWQGTGAVAMMEARYVRCVAVSKDGRWIAAGTARGYVCVWDAETHEQVLGRKEDSHLIHAVDFSPDSTKLVRGSDNGSATVWDQVTRKKIQTLRHNNGVLAAKYSAEGDRIATAISKGPVQIWDSNDGHLILNIPITVVPVFNSGLVWSIGHLFVISENAIQELDAFSGSRLSQWAVQETDIHSCIALPKHGSFVAYTANHVVTLWDTTTRSLIDRIQRPEGVRSIAISPDGRSIATGGDGGKIRIESLFNIPARRGEHPHRVDDGRDMTVPSISDLITLPTFRAPEFQIDAAILDAWGKDQFEEAEAALTVAITASPDPTYEMLASRALIRAHSREWATSLASAEMAIKARPSAFGFIAKSIAHAGKGERYEAYRACDIAFGYLDSSYITFLLLIKAIIVFMVGEHVDAVSRMEDLIATVPEASSSQCYVVQAYMHLLVGNLRMDGNNYKGAIESFENSRAKLRPFPPRSLFLVSLISGWKFDNLEFTTRQHLCEALYSAGRILDAIEGLRQLTSDFEEELYGSRDNNEWALDFRQQCSAKVMQLGDAAVNTKQYQEAITYYSAALSLDPPSSQDILIKRSKAYLETGSWQQALDDANQINTLDPSSPFGYEAKHAALHEIGDYENAVIAFEEMLSKLELSPDPEVQRLGDRYIHPSSTRAAIHNLVLSTTRRLPRELINTTDGRLYNRADLESVFQLSAIFQELVSAMTKRIDYARIKHAVRYYFQYVMLSHGWEPGEPLFQDVMYTSVYTLEPSPTHHKLQRFCQIVLDHGFIWAWSDTCCINKSDNFVLQEALVAMFKWYEGSTLTIVYLRGVSPLSQHGALVRSIWNTRAWTLQEYVAAKIVLFYTEDWTLYLNLQLRNHKELQEVVSEMEEATGVSAEELMALRPGLGSVREKLRLASTRKTTLVEDEAYSLLGIFSASGIPAIYGEGKGALGRLLANVMTRCGDASVLAWTGDSGPFNSCLPAHVSVYNGPVTSHLPAPISDSEMDTIITVSHTSPFDPDTALGLYDRLRDLPSPKFAESRMTLVCIMFQIPRLTLYHTNGPLRFYRTNTRPFGRVEIKTKTDLGRGTLYLVHPWLRSLLEHKDVHSRAFEDRPDDEVEEDAIDDEEAIDHDTTLDAVRGGVVGDAESYMTSTISGRRSPSLSPVPPSPIDRETQARRLVVRLRQPFGALLFKVRVLDQGMVVYERVAADSMIYVRFQEDFGLAQIAERVRTVDVL